MNRLAGAASAYLRSAAHQPIHWYPWGPEPFAAAAAADKPVLLDVGAVWCHWCHVMDGESYEDPALAELLNRDFVCIKVDRDERPDVDQRYQRAVQAITRQGGWPLTAFLTPEGDVFYGGTYFPPDGRYGRPGFRTVLEQVLAFWREHREQAVAQGRSLRDAVAAAAARPGRDAVGAAVLLAGERQMLAAFDPAFGGFGRAPKFPHPTALRFLMARWTDHGSAQVRHVVEETLRAMVRGGVHDQVGGGFHRYSVDRQWVVPHFEKMSYDNSELLAACVEAAALFDDGEFADAGRGILRWVRDVLRQPGGGFGTSQDADVDLHDDGSYFTWTREELAAVLDPGDLDLALRRFGIGTAGRMPHDPERNVLFQAASAAELATATGRTEAEVRDALERIVGRLREARNARPAPVVDSTPYAAWNAMMAGAFLRAGPVLGDPDAADQALAALRVLRRRAGDGPVPHAPDGADALLDDQVHTAAAALDAFEATNDAAWLAWAASLMERTWETHRDARHGGLRDRPLDAGGEGLLDAALIGIEDAPVPSANGVAGAVLARLAAHTGEPRWADRHRALVEAFGGEAPRLGLHAGAWLLAADWLVHGPTTLAVTGPPGDPAAEAMYRAALAAPLPRRVVRRLAPGEPAPVPDELRGLLASSGDAPRGCVCLGTRCLLPADDPAAWRARLVEARSARA